MGSSRKHTVGELLFATLLGVIAAIFTAVAAFIGGIMAGPLVFKSDEAAAWSGISLRFPAAAICAIVAFILTCRWALRYGEAKKTDHG